MNSVEPSMILKVFVSVMLCSEADTELVAKSVHSKSQYIELDLRRIITIK